MTFTQEVFNFCIIFEKPKPLDQHKHVKWHWIKCKYSQNPTEHPPSKAPPSLCTDESPWAEIKYYTVFWFITTDCSEQTVVPYWSL